MPMSAFCSSSMRPLALRTCTTGPLPMNRPVRSVASDSEPPPLLRRSTSTPSTFCFFSSPSSLATSRVAILVERRQRDDADLAADLPILDVDDRALRRLFLDQHLLAHHGDREVL